MTITTVEEAIRLGKELEELGNKLQEIDVNNLKDDNIDDGPMIDNVMSLRNHFKNQSKKLDEIINKK